MPKGQPQINITFDIDANSQLYVIAKESSFGLSNKIRITNEKERLSKDQIDMLVKECEIIEKDDKGKINAKKNFEIYCYGVKNIFKK